MSKPCPTERQRPERTGDDLNVNSPIEQHRDHQLQLAIPNKRVAANDREVQGLEAVDHIKNTVNQFLPFVIMETS
jgi:hypothetical protein